MAEDTNINEEQVLEEETLNQEGEIEANSQEPKTYTQEEVEGIKKKMQSDSDKGVQKLLREKEMSERYVQEYKKIANDDTRLVELWEEDPKLAQKFLDDDFEGMTIEEYKESIDYKEDYSDPAKMEAKIKREAKKLAEKEKQEAKMQLVEKEKEAFIAKLKMDEEEKEAFESELSDLLSLKKYQEQDIVKVMERAYKLSADEESLKKLKEAEVIARTQSATKGGSAKGEGNKQTQVQKDIADFKKKFNL